MRFVLRIFFAACTIGCAGQKGPAQHAAAVPTTPAANADAQSWRSVRPTPGPLPTFVPLVVETFRLANDVPVYVIENHSVPLVHVRVLVKGAGTGSVPVEQAGLPNFVTEAMRGGTHSHSASQIEDALSSAGATLQTETEVEWSSLAADTLRDSLPQTTAILLDLMSAPAFERASIELTRAHIIGDLNTRESDGKLVALDELKMLLWGTTSEALSPLGTRKSVERLSAAQLKVFYDAHWQPANVAIVVVGDVTPATVKELLSKGLSRWTAKAPAAASLPSRGVEPAARRLMLVDQPAAQQSTVCIGFRTLPRSSPEWAALDVVNRVLGGGYASRINLNIREDKGYSYNIRSALTENVAPGALYVRGTIVIDKTVAAVEEVLKEADRIRTHPPTDAELQSAKAAVIAAATHLETNAQLATAVTHSIVFGLPLDYLGRYSQQVRALTREQVSQVAVGLLDSARASVVILGPKVQIQERLSAAKLGAFEQP